MLFIVLLISLQSIFLIYKCKLTPSSLAALIFGLNLITFFVIENIKLTASIDLIYSHSYKFRTSYIEHSLLITLIYYSLFCICFFSALSAKKNAMHQSVNSNLIEKPFINIKLKPSALLTIILLIYVLLHAYYTKFLFLQEYSVYLSLRDLNFYEESGVLSKIIIGNIGSIGIIVTFLLGISSKPYKSFIGCILIIMFIYTLIFQLASLSRWASLQLIFIAFFQVTKKNRNLSIFFILLSFLSLIVILNARGSNTYSFLNLISGVDFTYVLILNFFANTFGGCFALAEALNFNDVTYSLNHKILSFSPLPSFIDGYTTDETMKLNVYGPFNTYAELFWFGSFWLILFYTIYAFTINRIEKFWHYSYLSNSYYLASHATGGLLIYGTLFTQQYPIRNSIRWILLAIFVYLISKIVMNFTKSKQIKI